MQQRASTVDDQTIQTLDAIFDKLKEQISQRDDVFDDVYKRAMASGDESTARYARGWQFGMDEALTKLLSLINQHR